MKRGHQVTALTHSDGVLRRGRQQGRAEERPQEHREKGRLQSEEQRLETSPAGTLIRASSLHNCAETNVHCPAAQSGILSRSLSRLTQAYGEAASSHSSEEGAS